MNTKASKLIHWLIVEDALRDQKGHWFEYISTFCQGLRKLGDEVTILADKEAMPFVLEQLKPQPVLPRSIWHRMSDKAGAITRYLRVPAHALQTVVAVQAYLSAFSDEYDVIFVPTVLVHHLLAWTWLIKWFLSSSRVRIILFFPNAPVSFDPLQGKWIWTPSLTTSLLRLLLRTLASDVKTGKVICAAETYPMQKTLSHLSSLPFTYFPHPVLPLAASEQERSSLDELVIGSYGGARHEKGSDTLFQGIAEFSRQCPDYRVRFMLQCLEDFAQERHLLKDNLQVKWITRYFQGSEYAHQLCQTHILLLPYRLSSYSLRVSRVVIEAIVNGIPVIATRGSTLAEQADEFGALVMCENEDPVSLAQAIQYAVEHYSELAAQAQAAAPKAQAHFSVRCFRECLFSNTNQGLNDLSQPNGINQSYILDK
ncbi:glycosyltransferase [Nostoc sp. NIES-2111]